MFGGIRCKSVPCLEVFALRTSCNSIWILYEQEVAIINLLTMDGILALKAQTSLFLSCEKKELKSVLR